MISGAILSAFLSSARSAKRSGRLFRPPPEKLFPILRECAPGAADALDLVAIDQGWYQLRPPANAGLWAQACVLYLREGAQAMERVALDDAEEEPLLRNIAFSILREVRGPETLGILLRMGTRYSSASSHPGAFVLRQLASALGYRLTAHHEEISSEDRAGIRKFAERILNEAVDPGDAADAMYLLRAVGDESSIRLIDARGTLEYPFDDCVADAKRAIKRRLKSDS